MAYDVTSPDGSVGINVVAEERTQYISGVRLYVDIFKNNQLICVLRVAYLESSATSTWFDTNIIINNKTPTSGANYNELRVNVTDQTDGITADLVIRVYNDMIAIRIENIPNGIQSPDITIEEIGEDEVIVSQPVNNLLEAGLERGILNDIGAANPGVARKAFLIDITKKIAITPITMQYLVYDATIKETEGTTGAYNLRIHAWPHSKGTAPNKANITEIDWIAVIFWDTIDEIRKVVENHISDFLTVKTFDRQIVRDVVTHDWYKKDIDEATVKNMADIVAEMGVTHLLIDDGWQQGTSATQIDTSKFPNGLSPVIQYIHGKGLKTGIHVYFGGVVNDGVNNCINTWKSWGLGSGDIIKIGFVSEYIYNTGDNYGAVQTLRQLVDKLYQEGFIVLIHELRQWAFALEYENISGIEIWWESSWGNVYNIIEGLWRYVESHDVDTDLKKHEGTTTIVMPSATLFGLMLYSFASCVVLDEWQGLDDSTKDLIRSLIQNRELIDTIELYDKYIVGKSNNIIVVTAFDDATININVPFDGYKITSGSGGMGLVKTPITAGTQSVSLVANDSVIFVSKDVIGNIVFQIYSCPSEVTTSPGASFTVSVTVVNNGDADGTVEVRVRDHNNSIVASKQVTVVAGGSQSLSLSATAPSSPGTYSWKVEAYNVDSGVVDDSKSFTVEVSGGVFGGIDIQQMMQIFLQLLPFIMLILIISILVAAIR